MALALQNGVRKVANKIARIIAAEMSGRARSNPGRGGLKLTPRSDHDDLQRHAQKLAAEWSVEKNKPASERNERWRRTPGKEVIAHITSGAARQPTAGEKALLSAAHRAAMTALKPVYGGGRGFILRHAGPKGGSYKRQLAGKGSGRYAVRGKSEVKTMKAFGKSVSYLGRNVPTIQRYNANRVGIRSSNAAFDGSTHRWDAAYKGKKVSGTILAGLPRKPKASPAAKKANTLDAKMYFAAQKHLRAQSSGKVSFKGRSRASVIQEAMATGMAKSNPGVFGGLALDNTGVFGGLALDNTGVFGGLALTNGPFVAAGVGAAKLIGTGVAAALSLAAASKYVDEYLPQIPVIGSYLQDIRVPESIPLIGGIGLRNTVAGAIIGGVTIAATQFAANKLGNRSIALYGGAIGAGILLIGPALDIAAGSSDKSGVGSDDLSGIALDNTGVFGGLALDNTGAYGDGMAYQLGALSGDDSDYAQASLGDAYYSGADFDVEEGEAMVQGRGQFQGKFGNPPVRIQSHGGQSGTASHLAGRKGHRWGWLVKMIGWKNVERLAALPARQRVQVLKQLRENALATFKQVLINNREGVLAIPEMVAHVAQDIAAGAEGVVGAHSSFGSTIFGGQGL